MSPIAALRKKSIRIEKPPPLTRDEVKKKEVEDWRKRYRAELDNIRLYLGIDFNLENLLEPIVDPYEQSIVSLHIEAKQRVISYRQLNRNLEDECELLEEKIDEETKRK